MTISLKILLTISLTLSLSGMATAGMPLSRLVFTPHWLPQAQFAGYYVALDQGFYEKAGLDVHILHPSASDDTMDYLKSGKADIISHFLVSALIARTEGIDLVNVGQLSQHSAMLFVSRKAAGINTLDDFEGKTAGVWLAGFGEIPRSMLEGREIAVQWYPILGTVNLFMAGGIDIMTVMWYNEYHQIYLNGLNHDELNTFFLSDYGYNIPEDGIYTLTETLESRRDEIRRFTEATLKGWDYAAENREYTLNLVVSLMRNYNLPANMAHQRWMLDRILEFQEYKTKGLTRTLLCPRDYDDTVRILQERGLMGKPCGYSVFHQPVLKDSVE